MKLILFLFQSFNTLTNLSSSLEFDKLQQDWQAIDFLCIRE